MADIKREVLINVIGTILATPLLLGVSWAVSRLSVESGVYLTVAQSVDAYGGLSVVTIQAENSSRVGFAPLDVVFPAAGRLQAAGAQAASTSNDVVVSGDFVRWSGRLPGRSTVAFVLVFKGTAPAIDPQTAFTANYAATDQQGFGVVRKALVRSEGEATAARLLLVAKWLGAVVALFIVIVVGRYAVKRFGKDKTT